MVDVSMWRGLAFAARYKETTMMWAAPQHRDTFRVKERCAVAACYSLMIQTRSFGHRRSVCKSR